MIDRKAISRYRREITLATLDNYLEDQDENARLAGLFFARMEENRCLSILARKTFVEQFGEEFELNFFRSLLVCSRELFNNKPRNTGDELEGIYRYLLEGIPAAAYQKQSKDEPKVPPSDSYRREIKRARK